MGKFLSYHNVFPGGRPYVTVSPRTSGSPFMKMCLLIKVVDGIQWAEELTLVMISVG